MNQYVCHINDMSLEIDLYYQNNTNNVWTTINYCNHILRKIQANKGIIEVILC